MTKPKPKEDPPIFSLFNEIGIIEQLARSAFERVMPDGMKVSHFAALNHLSRRAEPQSPARLAAAFQVTKGAMTNTLQRLEARGLVTVRPDPADGRAKLVEITPAGRKARDAAVAALAPRMAALARAIPESAFRDALPFLRRLRMHLDEARNAEDFPDQA